MTSQNDHNSKNKNCKNLRFGCSFYSAEELFFSIVYLFCTNMKQKTFRKILIKSKSFSRIFFLGILWNGFYFIIQRTDPPSPEMVRFSWKMRNALKRMKNQFSDLYILSYDRIYSQFPSVFTDQIWSKIMFQKIRYVLKWLFVFRTFFL